MIDKERIEKVHNCKHCFAIIKRGYHWQRFQYDEPPIIECIKCGINNKNFLVDQQKTRVYGFFYLSDEMRLFYHETADNNGFVDYSELPYLFDGKICTNDPYLLFQIVKEIKLSIDENNPAYYPMIIDTMGKLLVLINTRRLSLNNPKHVKLLYKLYEEEYGYQKKIK